MVIIIQIKISRKKAYGNAASWITERRVGHNNITYGRRLPSEDKYPREEDNQSTVKTKTVNHHMGKLKKPIYLNINIVLLN